MLLPCYMVNKFFFLGESYGKQFGIYIYMYALLRPPYDLLLQ